MNKNSQPPFLVKLVPKLASGAQIIEPAMMKPGAIVLSGFPAILAIPIGNTASSYLRDHWRRFICVCERSGWKVTSQLFSRIKVATLLR